MCPIDKFIKFVGEKSGSLTRHTSRKTLLGLDLQTNGLMLIEKNNK